MSAAKYVNHLLDILTDELTLTPTSDWVVAHSFVVTMIVLNIIQDKS